MDDKTNNGLQHVPTRSGGLALRATRAGIVARGRRDAAGNPEYRQALEDYGAERFGAAAEGFRRAAEGGHAESQYVLSTMLATGLGGEMDDAEAARWERAAAEQGHGYAQANVCFRSYEAEEFGEAFGWCERAAHGGLAWAQYYLGLMYWKGEGTARSNGDAAHWYRLAATQGFAEAQQRLGDLYYLGQGVGRNYVQAAAWYERAAEQGNAEAQFQLGHLYNMGLGVEHDYTQYRHWTRQAALQGHEEALHEVKRREYRDA